jgi:putative ABC transport system ATP-binding protein
VRALDGVDFAVAAGEFVAIMGPSGSGKSTLLHIIGALEPPTDGTVALSGRRYDGLGDDELTRLRREQLGFVFQFFNLLPSLSALENVLLPALIARRHGADALRGRANELLTRVSLAGRAEHTPSELSGGEQQRVSIARALLLSPQVVLADEPTGNLDSRAGAEILRLLRELNRDEHVTVVMVTHDPSAAAIADRVVFLRDGRIREAIPGGSTQDVIDAFSRMQAPEPALAGV